jgi:excisionase family DNA binding protein
MAVLTQIKEIAKYLHITPQTCYKYIKQGYLPLKKIGGSYIITTEALDRFIETKLQVQDKNQKK